MVKPFLFGALGLAAFLLPEAGARDGVPFVDAEKELRRRFGDDLPRRPLAEISRAIVEMAERLPAGGAIDLPRSVPCGTLDFRRVADHVQVTGGHGGTLVLGGGQTGHQILFSALDQVVEPDVRLFEKTAPASNLVSLFSSGSVQIKGDVRNCAWIAGANDFGRRTVTASARVDDSLFLWIGANWPFADYNAHLDPKNRDRNWIENAQIHFDCKGGGQNTRLYLLVETGYGNPGPQAIFENCSGLSAYHGSTERSSSQGPGVYWLRNCTNVRLGLRGLNAFHANNGGPRAPCPAHDLTVEGGSGNILHALRAWNYSEGATAVNTSPDLQAWMCGFQYEIEGFDKEGVLRFAVTPNLEKPVPGSPELEKMKAELRPRAEKILANRKQAATEENLKAIEKLLLEGRFREWPFNAREEQTFMFGSDDLTRPVAKLRNGRKLPPPPSMPATDAPRIRRPIAFTQAPGFGQAILDAGADPSGKAPSDDAFAKVMFGMTRDQVEEQLQTTYKADAEFREARTRKDEAAMKTAKDRIAAAMDKLHPPDPADKRNPPMSRIRRPRLEIPPGTFLVTRPVVCGVSGVTEIWGAGPAATVLKASGDFKVLEQHAPGTLANFAIEGGRVGLAITGADHGDPVSPTLQSYVAGGSYYNLTFRRQTFAGLHVGNDDPGVLGGAEHDQNRYVDLKFHNTGDYGIFMNQNMLDKWLCLHGEFRGQKKAGISIKYNNVIHGGIIGCTFRDIGGPGIDTLGGNPEIAYRPWAVMVDQCEFAECGSAGEAAVEMGYAELMSFTRCRIETKGKTILCGYRGSPQICEDVSVDVKVPEGKPAMALRGVRQIVTARANGHVFRGVKANGPVAFVNDANAHNEPFRRTLQRLGKGPEVDWDVCAAARENRPKNGWTHPFVFYRCEFGADRYGYALLNVDTDGGKVLERVDLGALE